MEVVGATPFEDITDYRASDDGSHVLIKGWIGTREDHLAIKEEDALFVIRGLAYGIDLCLLARGGEPELLRLMPVERHGFAVNRKNGTSALRLGFVGCGTLDFELPKGAAEELMQEMQRQLNSDSSAPYKEGELDC